LNAWQNRKVFILDLKVPSVSPSVTVRGREFQVAGAEQLQFTNPVQASAAGHDVASTLPTTLLSTAVRLAAVDIVK